MKIDLTIVSIRNVKQFILQYCNKRMLNCLYHLYKIFYKKEVIKQVMYSKRKT